MVITSYTLPWLVEDGIKIWLDGSHDSSSKRMQNRDKMSSKEAFEVTRKRYDKNKALYKKLYNFDFGEDVSVFDKIIHTDNLNVEQVIEISKETVRTLL
jgi:cytidylate kinase